MRVRRFRPFVPTEHVEQVQLVTWARFLEPTVPELALLFAVPNGGDRHPAVAAKLKSEGVRRGVPDLFLPVARDIWHGLFIEMKRQRGGNLNDPDQRWWRQQLGDRCFRVVVCKGADAASLEIVDYLGLPRSLAMGGVGQAANNESAAAL